MAENTENSSTISDEMDQSQREKAVSDLLADKDARDLMIEKLKASSHVVKKSTITAFPGISGYNAGGGAWPAFLMQFLFAAPFPPFWGPTHSSPVADTPQDSPPWFHTFAGPAGLLKFAGPGGGGGGRRRRGRPIGQI